MRTLFRRSVSLGKDSPKISAAAVLTAFPMVAPKAVTKRPDTFLVGTFIILTGYLFCLYKLRFYSLKHEAISDTLW